MEEQPWKGTTRTCKMHKNGCKTCVEGIGIQTSGDVKKKGRKPQITGGNEDWKLLELKKKEKK